VDVDVDEARGYVQPRDIHGLEGARRRNVLRHRGDPAVLDGDVAHGADAVPAVDDVTTLEEEVVLRLCSGGGGQQHDQPDEPSVSHVLSPGSTMRCLP
jgi:hypothetical protein